METAKDFTVNYEDFIEAKSHIGSDDGFEPVFMPDFLFDFQCDLVRWALLKGRAAIFADCGLGKSPMQLVWAWNVYRKTGKRVLILAPLAVSAQTEREARKFGIDCQQSKGAFSAPLVATNYQRLHYFKPEDFGGVVCDESGILKNFDGQIKADITAFMRKIKYRLLCTATAAPNDYTELGTSSEALGVLGYIDMLKTFFKSNQNTYAQGGSGVWGGRRFAGHSNLFGGKFRFRGHAERDFWRWVCSWARALRKPSDLGFSDEKFALPPLNITEHIVKASTKRSDMLFDLPATTLKEQRAERRHTLQERCEKAAELVLAHDGASISWCNLNDEGQLLESLIPGAVNVEGKDDDDYKEEVFDSFSTGKIQRIISKGSICGLGMNWQHCSNQTYFSDHSYERFYQCVRRSYRFGQKNPVSINVIASEGESGVLKNLKRKAAAADEMFAQLVCMMNNELRVNLNHNRNKKENIPAWLSPTK